MKNGNIKIRKADQIITKLETDNERMKEDLEMLERRGNKYANMESNELRDRLQDAER